MLTFTKIKRYYHKLMYVYHATLYRDCRDIQMKKKFWKKAKQHEAKIN
jgi:hypothetical protein